MSKGRAVGDGARHMFNTRHVPSILLIQGFSEKVLLSLFLLGAFPSAHVSRCITNVWKSRSFCNALPDSKFKTKIYLV